MQTRGDPAATPDPCHPCAVVRERHDMGSATSRLRRFLTAEEVPRWFGLSIVLIYLVGLGAVARLGIEQARLEAAANIQQTGRYAVELLAERLSSLTQQTADERRAAEGERQALDAVERALREFTLSGPAQWARIVDHEDHVVASADSQLIVADGTTGVSPATLSGGKKTVSNGRPSGSTVHVPTPQTHFVPPGRGRADVLVRVRLEGWRPFHHGPDESTEPQSGPDSASDRADSTSALPGSAPAPASEVYYLEVGLPSQPLPANGPAQQAGTLAIILVVLGALFVVYRCLREQLRGVSRIVDRLQSRRAAGLEDDLRSLRIADTFDGVTTAWNELVDLTERLFQTVRCSQADQELSRALKQSNGGALAEGLNAVPDGIICLADPSAGPPDFEYLNAAARRLFGWTHTGQRSVRNPTSPPDSDEPEGFTPRGAASGPTGLPNRESGDAMIPSPPDPALLASLADARAEGIAGKVLDALRDARSAEGGFEARTVTLVPDAQESIAGTAEARSAKTDASDCGLVTADCPTAYRLLIYPIRRGPRRGGCVAIIRDISQQCRADRARDEFITNVTHELRTPLTNIRAYAETLSSGMFDDPNTITECYNVITKETRRLSRLIEDVLSVSQMEVGTLELDYASVDLRALLGDAVRDVRGLADEKRIDLTLTLPAKLEPLRADRDKLAVVFNNLLANAIKYTPPEGNVIVGCQFNADETIVSIKDNGIGIDPADHARIFEKFQRGGDAKVQAQPGTGIGLYTAREIVRRHRGDIQLISGRGQGSTFLVHLPRHASRA